MGKSHASQYANFGSLLFFELNRDMMKLTYKNHSAANGFSFAAE